jgi:hypothetical protein
MANGERMTIFPRHKAKYGNIDDTRIYLQKFIEHKEGGTLYICGPMRGIKDNNFPAFDAAAASFREREWNVINPAEIDRDLDQHVVVAFDYPAYRYAARDLTALFYYCDGIAILPGWRNSKGARAEVFVALWLGLDVYDAITHRRIPPEEIEALVREPDSFSYRRYKMESGVMYFSDDDGKSWSDCSTEKQLPPEEPKTTQSVGTILEEAQHLVHGDRGNDYGHPLDDFRRTVGAFNALTGHDLKVEEGPLFMCCVKLSREANKHKRDNLVDNAGYSDCIQQIHEEVERRGACTSSSGCSGGGCIIGFYLLGGGSLRIKKLKREAGRNRRRSGRKP